MKKIVNVFVILFSLIFGLTPFGHATPFQNGGFEESIWTASEIGAFKTLLAGDTGITGWTVETGSDGIDYIGTVWAASEGDRSIDLNGQDMGVIGQTFDTVSGYTYLVQFDMAGNFAGEPLPIKTLRVSAGSFVGDFSFDTTGKIWPDDSDNMGWIENSFMFIALGTSTTLTFQSLTPESAYGPALDNVRLSVAPVPEPATMFLLGFGLIGMAIFARRKFGK